MKYEPLYKTYYKSKQEYQALYESRYNSREAVKLGIEISGNESFYLPCNELYSLSSSILRVDKKVSLLRAQLPNQAIHQFRMESLIDEIIITNNIEGVHSTRREIKDVIDSLGESNRHEKRFEGLINQYILLGEKNIELQKCQDLRVLYNNLVLNEVLENDPDNAPDGEIFRKDTVNVRNAVQKIIHTGVYPEEKVIAYMQRSMDILNDDNIDILVRTAAFHYLFGYIHPFYDGNGRLSRFISSYYLSKDLDSLVGNRLSYTIQDNISEYYKLFKICNDPINKGDITPFIIMFLSIVLKAEENLLYALTKRSDLYEINLKRVLMLSIRDKWDKTTEALCHTLLISALFAKNGANKKELLQYLKIKSNTTLNTKLKNLRVYDLIEEAKDGNTVYYKLKYENLSKALGIED
ncbi:MAG: Fic family protein [Coprococcus sp.]